MSVAPWIASGGNSNETRYSSRLGGNACCCRLRIGGARNNRQSFYKFRSAGRDDKNVARPLLPYLAVHCRSKPKRKLHCFCREGRLQTRQHIHRHQNRWKRRRRAGREHLGWGRDRRWRRRDDRRDAGSLSKPGAYNTGSCGRGRREHQSGSPAPSTAVEEQKHANRSLNDSRSAVPIQPPRTPRCP